MYTLELLAQQRRNLCLYNILCIWELIYEGPMRINICKEVVLNYITFEACFISSDTHHSYITIFDNVHTCIVISVDELNVIEDVAMVLSKHNCLSDGARCISHITLALSLAHFLTCPV